MKNTKICWFCMTSIQKVHFRPIVMSYLTIIHQSEGKYWCILTEPQSSEVNIHHFHWHWGDQYCFSIYHTSWITSGPKSNFVWDNIITKAILFFFSYLEVNSTWLITSEPANKHAQKVLFTCVVNTYIWYYS